MVVDHVEFLGILGFNEEIFIASNTPSPQDLRSYIIKLRFVSPNSVRVSRVDQVLEAFNVSILQTVSVVTQYL